jgi:hypothetical protein
MNMTRFNYLTRFVFEAEEQANEVGTFIEYLCLCFPYTLLLVGSIVLNRYLDDLDAGLWRNIGYVYSWVFLVLFGQCQGSALVSPSEGAHQHIPFKGPSPLQRKYLVCFTIILFIIGVWVCFQGNKWPSLWVWFSRSLFICSMLNMIGVSCLGLNNINTN